MRFTEHLICCDVEREAIYIEKQWEGGWGSVVGAKDGHRGPHREPPPPTPSVLGGCGVGVGIKSQGPHIPLLASGALMADFTGTPAAESVGVIAAEEPEDEQSAQTAKDGMRKLSRPPPARQAGQT